MLTLGSPGTVKVSEAIAISAAMSSETRTSLNNPCASHHKSRGCKEVAEGNEEQRIVSMKHEARKVLRRMPNTQNMFLTAGLGQHHHPAVHLHSWK